MAEKIMLETQKRQKLINELNDYLREIKKIYNNIEDLVNGVNLYVGMDVGNQLRNKMGNLKNSMNNTSKNLKRYSDDIILASVKFRKADMEAADLIRESQRKLDTYK